MESCNTPGKGKPLNSQPTRVRVVVRVRPFLAGEISGQNADPVSCISLIGSEEPKSCDDVIVHLKDQETSRNECFKLDGFFGQEDNSVSTIFENEVRPLIPGIFQGCNVTVFAHGATGSGKTYTMQGIGEHPGLMHLAMAEVFNTCINTETSVKISYYEVYMDRCYDLLEVKPKEIAIMDDKDGQIHLRGLSQAEVSSISEFQETFSCAIQRRKVARTGLNDVSSRSHGVLVISVSSRSCGVLGSANILAGKLNLIDLAGFEDNKKTGNEGIRLQESSKINQSLFALSNVIYALNNNKPRIPYRESKLTRILQDSLGGRSQALMVACLNPGEYQESVHTVSLASRTRQMNNFASSAQKKNTPKVDMEIKLRNWLESKGKSPSAQRIGQFGTPLDRKSAMFGCSSKKPNIGRSSAKSTVLSNQGCSSLHERVACVARRNLFDFGDLADTIMEDPNLSAERTLKDKFEHPIQEVALRPAPSSFEGEHAGRVKTIESVNVNIKPLESPLRKALSPINSNINNDRLSSKDQLHIDVSDPKTPKAPFFPGEGFGASANKFHSRGSNLKSTLIEEYVHFLNTATREELLELKGIGHKMAEYITELRDTSPLKSLKDLEKIGLSSKQVHNMFNKAARGIF